MSLFLLLLLLLPFITLSSQSSIRNLLEARGLPGGLFPDNVESYSLDVKTGELEVQLQNPCFARFENRVYFDSVVKANLSYGGLVGLQGLTQEELFLWLPVKGIAVNDSTSGLVLFDIGVAHKQISRSLFEDPPVCYPPGKSKFVTFSSSECCRCLCKSVLDLEGVLLIFFYVCYNRIYNGEDREEEDGYSTPEIRELF